VPACTASGGAGSFCRSGDAGRGRGRGRRWYGGRRTNGAFSKAIVHSLRIGKTRADALRPKLHTISSGRVARGRRRGKLWSSGRARKLRSGVGAQPGGDTAEGIASTTRAAGRPQLRRLNFGMPLERPVGTRCRYRRREGLPAYRADDGGDELSTEAPIACSEPADRTVERQTLGQVRDAERRAVVRGQPIFASSTRPAIRGPFFYASSPRRAAGRASQDSAASAHRRMSGSALGS